MRGNPHKCNAAARDLINIVLLLRSIGDDESNANPVHHSCCKQQSNTCVGREINFIIERVTKNKVKGTTPVIPKVEDKKEYRLCKYMHDKLLERVA